MEGKTIPQGATERRYFGVEEFVREAKRQGAPISRGIAYEAIRSGRIPSARIGRRYVVPVDALDRLINGQGPDALEPPPAVSA